MLLSVFKICDLKFGQIPVLQHVNLSVHPGQMVAIVSVSSLIHYLASNVIIGNYLLLFFHFSGWS